MSKSINSLFFKNKEQKFNKLNLKRFEIYNSSLSQKQTAKAFTNKWSLHNYESSDFSKMVERQKNRYLKLYGFSDENALKQYLRNCEYIYDAGCGLGHKAAWFAELSPESLIVAADISDAVVAASNYYKDYKNIVFIQCDIAKTNFLKDDYFDYVSCDQVIHHTTDPYKTFIELLRLTKSGKEMSVYVYRKKALPRELLDEYFRDYSMSLSHEQLFELSEQLTHLGKLLSTIEEEFDFPEIPLLGISGGKQTIQRFIYYNFLKCHWNEEAGYKNSVLNNYDWYSPSQAFRYSEEEFKQWFLNFSMEEIYFWKENACYSARYKKIY